MLKGTCVNASRKLCFGVHALEGSTRSANIVGSQGGVFFEPKGSQKDSHQAAATPPPESRGRWSPQGPRSVRSLNPGEGEPPAHPRERGISGGAKRRAFRGNQAGTQAYCSVHTTHPPLCSPFTHSCHAGKEPLGDRESGKNSPDRKSKKAKKMR